MAWAEALDGGDLRNKAPQRDKVLASKAPFNAPPVELIRLQDRFARLRAIRSSAF